jgi:hypothetical protein
MAYVMAVLLVVLVVGLVVRLALGVAKPRPGRDDADITDRDVVPPTNPDQPIPGSATRRHQQGMP